MLILCNILIPQVLWIPKVRANTGYLFGSRCRPGGHVAGALRHHCHQPHRDFLPSSWGHYTPTRWDYAVLAGTIGFFATAMFIFIRIMPSISIFEMRTLLPEAEVETK